MQPVTWAKYSTYEGPMCLGGARFQLPADPEPDDMILAVITATEGGSWNAVNMYDSCICTVGLIQWCEANQYSVSDMLGWVVSDSTNGVGELEPLQGCMERLNADFHRNQKGNWRFFTQAGGEVDTRVEQQRLFFLDVNGKLGSWTDDASKAHAREWCQGLATLFEKPSAIESQKKFTLRRLHSWFSLPYSKQLLDVRPKTPVGYAFEACFLSFAANNPTWADKYLRQAVESSLAPRWSVDWLVDCLQAWTNGPNVSIYPHRYNAIRPVVEKLYGIDLPDLAGDLSLNLNTFEVQAKLVHTLHYDLGPGGPQNDGVDGRWGPKSQTALVDFQRRNGLQQSGWPDAATNGALLKAS